MVAGSVLLWLSGWACDSDAPAAPTHASAQQAAPDEDGDAEAGRKDATASVTHTIGKGETLWDIARAYNVHVDAILARNGLHSDDVRRLRDGQALEIPGAEKVVDVETAADRAASREKLPPPRDGAYHFLQPGESLWSVARRYETPIEKLMDANHFTDAEVARLQVGQPIIVPGISQEDVQEAAKGEPAEDVALRHQIVAGETIWDLAGAFQVGVSEIMAANGLSKEDVRHLHEGQLLLIPGVEKDERGRIRRRATARERRAKRIAKRLGLGTRRVAGKLLHGRVKKSWKRAAGGAQRFPGSLRWPVTNGWYVRGFGSGLGGYHQAVDIMGEIGWNVRAAARGIVAYSGDELRGYGNVVMVVHPGGWVTMYAHNSVNFVTAGQRVPRGAILAEVGSTGISRGPHVHFEFLYNGKSCDPAYLFRPGIRERDGDKRQLDYIRWRNARRHPPQVECEPRKSYPKSRWVVNENPEKHAEQ